MKIRSDAGAVGAMCAFTVALWPYTAHGQGTGNVFYGGGIGLAFGDVDYFEISPLVGVNVNPQTAVGVSFLYRRRTDDRFSRSLTTNDYGATLFARYKVASPFYLQAEYEYLNYEFVRANLTVDSDDFSSILAGAGVSQPMGQNSSFFATALYNFSYDEPESPYSDPWVIRFGVSVGF